MKILSVALLSSFVCSAAVNAQTVEPPQIIVTGEGVVKVTPDQAWLQIGAESRSKVSKEAQQRNAEVMTAVQQKISAFAIPKDAIRTVAVDLQPEFDYANGKQTLRGYVARNTVEVRVDDLTKLGDVLDAAVASGAATIHGLRFDVKARGEAEQAALQAAVKNAVAKAQAVATGLQRSVERIIKIEELSGGAPVPMMKQFSMAARADASTPVAPGELEIRAEVRLSVSIK